MKPNIKELYTEAHALHMRILALLLQVERPTGDQEDNADTLYALQKTAELLDETRKAINRKHAQYQVVTVSMAAELGELTIRTPWCTVSCSTTAATEVPTINKNKDLYTEFLRTVLGIDDEDVIESGVVSIHFKHWEEYYTTQMLGKGRDLSPELAAGLKQYTAPKTTIRKNRDLLEPLV